jgi:hypothetical protein
VWSFCHNEILASGGGARNQQKTSFRVNRDRPCVKAGHSNLQRTG